MTWEDQIKYEELKALFNAAIEKVQSYSKELDPYLEDIDANSVKCKALHIRLTTALTTSMMLENEIEHILGL